MLSKNFDFGASSIQLSTCDKYVENAYLPSEHKVCHNKIVICANIANNTMDMAAGMNRGLIQMYDHYRGGNEYSFSNCKHLACTEVLL